MRDQATLKRLGFMTEQGSTHTARTIMLDELVTLFDWVEPSAPAASYQLAITDQNCLSKRSGRTRLLTARHLTALYGLDPTNPIHAGLRFFWLRDEAARPQLALLAAATRDSLLHDTAPSILATSFGSSVSREWVEEIIETKWPERFSAATRKSVAQNINSSLTKSGHLKGRINKVRTQLEPATGAVAYALYLAWLQDGRGELLLHSPWCKLLDASQERLLQLAAQASAKGWMVMRRVDSVIDIDFPALLPLVSQVVQPYEPETASQQETFHEQG